uniref:RIKEN cDNA 4933402J07 gene n=1 Tax=Cricetulus griseus TaxID=10029 RepID=A0A8C2MTJ6_CRIGR
MSDSLEDLKDLMPTERKSMWRTPEERRMSDLTRVLEWLERRQGKKKRALQLFLLPFQKKMEEKNVAEEKVGKKTSGAKKKPDKEGHRVTFSKVITPPKKSATGSSKGQGTGKRANTVSNNFNKDSYKKSGKERTYLDIKDVIALETNTRVSPYRRQSSIDPVLQETMFGARRVGLLRDWAGKAPDERKLKSLMEKGTEPKMEIAKMLKPEEVLSCRYLRLSKNNIKTLIKLCKDAGMDVDIHPHMVEAEIDSKKIFDHQLSTAL